MKITFVSNYINHHQIPVSNTLYEHLGENYHFIQTEPMEEERIKMGWQPDHDALPYLKLFYREEEECRRMIGESDVVIFGWSPEELITERLEEGKPVIRYSERIYREGQWKAVSPRGLVRKYHDHVRHRRKPVLLLCAGAYVASDFHLISAYPGKMFRWGYFPEYCKYDIDSLMRGKGVQSGCTELLWAGRMIECKHVEFLVPLAEELKNRGYRFHLTVIGDGDRKKNIQDAFAEKNLSDEVTLSGFKKPDEVRTAMEGAHIFLATSDYKEGWGAVINEAMNSGCAVVASHAMGAVPYLISHGENGMIFKSGNVKDLIRQTERVVSAPEFCEKLGRNAYRTISEEWNAKVAGERLLRMCEGLLQGEKTEFEAGPCSPAPIIAPYRMYREVTK